MVFELVIHFQRWISGGLTGRLTLRTFRLEPELEWNCEQLRRLQLSAIR
jgi:hypothetical protein